MATIRKRNGRWQVQIRKSGTRAISRTFTLKQDALFWAREQERVLEHQTDVLEKRLSMPLWNLYSHNRDTSQSRQLNSLINRNVVS